MQFISSYEVSNQFNEGERKKVWHVHNPNRCLQHGNEWNIGRMFYREEIAQKRIEMNIKLCNEHSDVS